jgi:hypothetical protein
MGLTVLTKRSTKRSTTSTTRRDLITRPLWEAQDVAVFVDHKPYNKKFGNDKKIKSQTKKSSTKHSVTTSSVDGGTEMEKIVNFQHSQFPLSRKPTQLDEKSFDRYAKSRCETTDLEKQKEREELITLCEVMLEFSDDTWDKKPAEPNDTTKDCFFTNAYHLWNRKYSKDLQRFKILDANDLGMTTHLLRAFPEATIYVCNPCASLIAKGTAYKNLNRKYPGQIHLFTAYEHEQIFHLADIHHSGWKNIPDYNMIWYDTCGAAKDTDLKTIELYFHLNMFPKDRPSVFSATFCGRDGGIYTNIAPEIRATFKDKHETPGKFVVDDFIQMCARSAGYIALRPSRLMLPRLKKGLIYSWTYIIVPMKWYAENFERAMALEHSVNWCLADYRDISGNKNLTNEEKTGKKTGKKKNEEKNREYYTFKEDFYYDGQKINLPK